MPHVQLLLSNWGVILLQLLIAVFCGGVIGYQRETFYRPAGFRTHILVCVGSAVYMLVSVVVAGDRFDPGRIAAQVASGMGFLGAGTIIKQGNIVQGLTTAASLWAVAGIGLAIGYGRPALDVALLGTLVVFLTLSALKRVERLIERKHICSISLTLMNPRAHIASIRETLGAHGIEVFSLAIEDEDQGKGLLVIQGRAPSHEAMEEAASAITASEHVMGANWSCR